MREEITVHEEEGKEGMQMHKAQPKWLNSVWTMMPASQSLFICLYTIVCISLIANIAHPSFFAIF